MADARPDAGVPDWMAQAGIKKGEYLMLSKSQLKTRQRPGNPLKVQVWATGILHTAGYKGQKAVTMSGGKTRLLTPSDIIRELHSVACAFFQQGGIQLSDAEVASLKETKEHIRSVLAELEDEGIALRTDAAGRKLSDLKPEELRRLSNGKTIMYFWLKPKDAQADIVAEEWARHLRQKREKEEIDEVAKNQLQQVSINHILKIFEFGKLSKKQISDPQTQAAFAVAFDAAKKAFRQALEVAQALLPEVAPEVLPTEVAPPVPLEVAPPVGALERKDEIKEKLLQQQPDAPPVEILMTELAARHLTVALKRAGKILNVLQATPLEYFLHVLDRRRSAGRITAGLLEHVADDARIEYAGVQDKERQEQERQRKFEIQRAEKAVQQAKYMLEHPEIDYSPAEIEWANEILREQGAA